MYTIRACTVDEYRDALDTIAQKNTASVSFLQAPLYGRIQEKSGKDVVYFTIQNDQQVVGAGLGVVYTASGGLRFLYCPYGPVVTDWDSQLARSLHALLRPIARTHNCSFVRLDADGLHATSGKKPSPAALARTASLQPRAEWGLDITPDIETLWQSFHKHARYHVRLSERAAAEVTLYTPHDAPLDALYSLMQTTGQRDAFGIFDKSYYAAYLKTLRDDEGFVVLVSIEGMPAAVGVFVVYDGQAHYVFAGSSNDYRKIAPAYAVIWHALQQAKKRGCVLFNFGGVSDDVKGQHLAGVSGFKSRFGGSRVEHPNPIDLVYSPLYYTLFTLYKTLRK